MDPQRIKSFAELVKLFQANNFPHAVDPVNSILETPSRATPLPGNLYYKWSTGAPFLQIVHYVMDDVPADRLAEVQTALTRLNTSIECPCFGYDYSTRRLYYRITVPAYPDDGIAPDTLERLTIGCIATAKDMLNVFAQVVAGRPGSEVDKIIHEMKTTPPKQADA